MLWNIPTEHERNYILVYEGRSNDGFRGEERTEETVPLLVSAAQWEIRLDHELDTRRDCQPG